MRGCSEFQNVESLHPRTALFSGATGLGNVMLFSLSLCYLIYFDGDLFSTSRNVYNYIYIMLLTRLDVGLELP